MSEGRNPTDRRPDDGALQERRRGYGRALRIGLGISLLFHLLLLLVLGRSLRMDAPAARGPTADEPVELQGPLAVEIGRILPPGEVVEEEEEEAVRPPEDVADPPIAQPERPPAERAPRGDPVPADAAAGADTDAEGYLTNAEKLHPKEGDERLYNEYADDEIPEYLAQNPYARYEGEIRARLGIILDSLALSEEQRRKAMEWLTGDEGSEWGVSEQGIHIGGIVIPIDLRSLLQEEGPAGRERRRELRDLGDIQYHDMMDDARAVQEERAREMRERTKEELERRLRDSLEAAQDTTDSADED